MSSDRSVTTDALATLGTIIDESAKRDAIHLAVDPVIAGEVLQAGQNVYLYRNKAYGWRKGLSKPLGIVDPFLKVNVKVGQRFWLVVYPRQITSLRHVWSHPDFPEVPEAQVIQTDPIAVRVARGWMEAYADSCGVEAEVMIQAAKDYLEHGDYLSEGGKFESMTIPDDFWNHYGVIVGEVINPDRRGNFFSCSC